MTVSDAFVFTFGRARIGGIPTEPWYLLAPLSDSGEELRAKIIKSIRLLGATNASSLTIQIYAFDVEDQISVTDMEQGLNATHTISLLPPGSAKQFKLEPINIPNAVLHTMRISASNLATGATRWDEIIYEVAVMGARR